MTSEPITRNITTQSWFDQARFVPPDVIFALTAQYVADKSPKKVNLGQGTYRDEHGNSWVLPSVRESRKLLAQELNHEYLPIVGLADFRKEAAKLALGSELFQKQEDKLATCQSLSGTGALHLAGLLLRACKTPLPKVYIPEPTWSNHHQVFSSLGFQCQSFRYYNPETKDLDIDSYYSALKSAEPDSVFIIHACAHNPTGCDPSKEQWQELARLFKERQLFPLFDAAYLGFNSGHVDNDAFAIRLFIEEMNLEAGVCLSFAKNMGLYGERVGCFLLATSTEEAAVKTQSMLEMLQRSEVSNPPAYGAKIASTILADATLRGLGMTICLVASGAPGTWDHLIRQSGMFGFLGLSPSVVLKLREKYHIYMADNSRISIAGLNRENVEYVGQSITDCLKQE
ncbi:aminotransferase [Penicillium coprophilum]|uniref:aminotransferase n=1 Tax=Penicillium coprophilum TaxID=36646 RepID=UPI002390BA92|nr:aminotransferase [Penicillium coprophilum]KAJ5169997.1 aminotransferase [Penicillium coprophilum]